MKMNDTGQITQKDLLKLLVDQAQHNATRDELNRVEDKLIIRIDAVETKLSARIDAVETKLSARIDEVDTKLSTRIGELETKMDMKFSSLKSTIIVTAIGSVIALGGLLIALAQLIKA
ncbi:hypothetical protein [Vibrio misgurnus]|uniref:hypothetical protein n=1 Tax=Vibrio TaxID=662 RepID=UPI0023F9F295|nr:hypothetical protein [Vibrio sp. VCS]